MFKKTTAILFLMALLSISFGAMQVQAALPPTCSPPTTTCSDNFNSSTLNTSLWTQFGGGGPTLTPTTGGLVMDWPGSPPTCSPPAGGSECGAGIASNCELSGDFTMSVTINLQLWPNGTQSGAGSGVRVGLATSLGPVMERDKLGNPNPNLPNSDYPGQPRNVYLMDAPIGGTQGIVATGDTNVILNLTRTGNMVKGYWWDFTTMQWFPAGGDGTYTVPTSNANFGLNVWSPQAVFQAASEVKLAFTNFNAIARGPAGVVCPSGTPKLSTAISPSSTINLGQSVTDQATITGGSAPVSGTVSYFFFNNSFCSGAATPKGSVTVGIGNVTVGTNPIGVGVNPTTNIIYVANFGSNSVSVIDGSTNTVTATITVGTSPRGVGVNPTTNRIYVANASAFSVSVIDGSTNTVTATITVGRNPQGVGVNPTTNRIYVSSDGSFSVSVIDGNTNTIPSPSPLPSNSVTPSSAGGFSFKAMYSGDANNNAATSACEPLAVNSGSVGGIVVPVDKLALLAPYIGLVSAIVAIAVATVYRSRGRHEKDGQRKMSTVPSVSP